MGAPIDSIYMYNTTRHMNIKGLSSISRLQINLYLNIYILPEINGGGIHEWRYIGLY